MLSVQDIKHISIIHINGKERERAHRARTILSSSSSSYFYLAWRKTVRRNFFCCFSSGEKIVQSERERNYYGASQLYFICFSPFFPLVSLSFPKVGDKCLMRAFHFFPFLAPNKKNNKKIQNAQPEEKSSRY